MSKKIRKAATSLAETPVSPIDALCKKLDECAYDMETRWGRGVLQSLCTSETSAKWCRVSNKVDTAIQGGDYDTVKSSTESLIRGWKKMEEEAISMGYSTKMHGQVWFVCSPEAEGIEYIVCKNELDSARMAALYPAKASSIYTLKDIARMIDAQSVTKMPKKEREYFTKVNEKMTTEEFLSDSIPLF